MKSAPASAGSFFDHRRPAGASAWPAGLGRQGIVIIVCIALINALRRTIFNIAGDPDFTPFAFAVIVVTGLLVGFAMLLAVVVTLKRYPKGGRSQYVAIAAAILVSSAISALAKDVWEMAALGATMSPNGKWGDYFRTDWVRYALLGGLIAGSYLYLRAEAENSAVAHRYAVDSSQMARRVAEARLRLLEAQIEPHFLFNTLATVSRLFETDPRAGERMLDNLIRYLSAALPQMRSEESTLGGEAALAETYLVIQGIRMGRRLRFTVSIPPSLREARLPPFMLLTLTENAITHGLNPLPDGGALHVSARSMDSKLVVEVRDSGRGFHQSFGTGTGLANIRARLDVLYGPNGSLNIAHNEPHGVVAMLAVPLESASNDSGK